MSPLYSTDKKHSTLLAGTATWIGGKKHNGFGVEDPSALAGKIQHSSHSRKNKIVLVGKNTIA